MQDFIMVAQGAVPAAKAAQPAATPSTSQAILDQTNHALSAISAANSALANMLAWSGVLITIAIALISVTGVFMFRTAVSGAAKAAADKANEKLQEDVKAAVASVREEAAKEIRQAVEQAKEVGAAEAQHLSAEVSAVFAGIESHLSERAKELMEHQASYRTQLEVEFTQIKSELSGRVDEIAQEQLARLEEIVAMVVAVPEANKAKMEEFFQLARLEEEKRKREFQRRLDEVAKAYQPPTQATSSIGGITNNLLALRDYRSQSTLADILAPREVSPINALRSSKASDSATYRAVTGGKMDGPPDSEGLS